MFLRSVKIRDIPAAQKGVFPFTLPWLQNVEQIHFVSPVTFFVGENGCGKSTLLESLAALAGSIVVGSADLDSDPSMEAPRVLAGHLSPTWNRRPKRGFFMRAEDFLNFARGVDQLRTDLEREREEAVSRDKHRSLLAQQLGQVPYRASIGALKHRYGDLEARSHGESFFEVFSTRIVPNGLYLLDEPETPLSPLRQLAFIALIKEKIAEGCQFIIATHSPILMAFPGATIFHIDSEGMHRRPYDELEHVRLTRDFLNHPEEFLRRL